MHFDADDPPVPVELSAIEDAACEELKGILRQLTP
jgi:hypothetical protein